MIQIYLLDLTEFHTPEQLTGFCEKAMSHVDAVRREKAARIRGKHERALSLGAGLLLQWMALEWMREDCGQHELRGHSQAENREKQHGLHGIQQAEDNAKQVTFTASELLDQLEKSLTVPFEFNYRFGEHGKPEIVDFPRQFSLSHSGDYVLCAVSDRPIGADIQQLQTNADLRKLADRFCPETERDAVLQAADETTQRRIFFRFWTRREAYAKLTGESLPTVLGSPLPESLEWITIAPPPGYAAAICRI